MLVLLYNKFPIKYERPCKSGKTIIHLFAPEQSGKVGKVKNASVSRPVFENGVFHWRRMYSYEKSAGKPVKVLLLTFLYSMAAGYPARPKSLRPNHTWHSARE